METKKNLLILAALMMSFTLVGCSSKKSSNGSVPIVEDNSRNDSSSDSGSSSTTPPNDSDWGAMGYLDITSTSAFKSFSGYNVEDLKNERIYLKLEEVNVNGVDYYEGEIRLAYDYEYIHNQFSSTPGMIETVYKHPRFAADQYSEEELDDNPRHLSAPIHGVRFNKAYYNNGRKYLVAFFEEPDFYDYSPWNWSQDAKAGAVMIIIDSFEEDDGWSGSVWFHNYDFAYSVKPTYTRCWDIEIGPYSCTDFVVSGDVRPDLDITPNTFTKLGEFYNLSKDEILGN